MSANANVEAFAMGWLSWNVQPEPMLVKVNDVDDKNSLNVIRHTGAKA